ncbi:MAG: hypothetical protein AAGC51_08560 [Flavobacterium lindanitolerans]|nr:hypothetical protein [Flavobacterium lindanitolerans]MDQ7961212.1 hypothetical protein [Flavobacterium lindanitolerans]
MVEISERILILQLKELENDSW